MTVNSSVELMLSGWGKHPVVKGRVLRKESVAAVEMLVGGADSTSMLARGLGRSYGDAAMNSKGTTLLTERLNHFLQFDDAEGILRAEAGVTLDEILRVIVPRGWFLPVTPGTKRVTIGGAAACDIHGKNHHKDGSLSSFIREIRLVTASGQSVDCSREKYKDLFWSTIGGMGLTGIISEVELTLTPVETSYINVTQTKTSGLNETIELLKQFDKDYQYTVAWIDCLKPGKGLGRGIIITGNHARMEDLPDSKKESALSLHQDARISIPCDFPGFTLNRHSISAFNQLKYALQFKRSESQLAHYDPFFYPLDGLRNWNRLYGKGGFIQYQFAVPDRNGPECVEKILKLVNNDGPGSYLGVLKRFGEQEGLLSFPVPGYTLALDIPVTESLPSLTDRMDQIVISCRGRVYLAKDACLSPESFRAMYPDYPRWLEIKKEIDPENHFTSELSRRLNMFAP